MGEGDSFCPTPVVCNSSKTSVICSCLKKVKQIGPFNGCNMYIKEYLYF